MAVQELQNAVRHVIESDGLNVRKGWRAKSLTLREVILHLSEESWELYDAHFDEDDMAQRKEAADVLNVLLSICYRKGWDFNDIAELGLAKLKERFPSCFPTTPE